MTAKITEALSRADLEKMVRSLHRNFGNRANFRGADVGYKWVDQEPTDEICLRVHVQEKLPIDRLNPSQIFPRQIDGVTLDVISAAYHPGAETATGRTAEDRQPMVMGGMSCGRAGARTGTLGLIAIDATTGRPGLLSSWHNLAGPNARYNDPIMQAGEQNGSHDPRDHIARLTRWVLGRSGDAAFAELLSDQPWLPLQMEGFKTIRSCRSPKLGETLTKSVGPTDLQRARVDGIGLYRLQYETRPGFREYRDIEGFRLSALPNHTPDAAGPTHPEDDGAIWVSEGSDAAVGMQFAHQAMPASAGSIAGTSSIACDVPTVLDRLQLRLANFQDLLDQCQASAISPAQQQTMAELTAHLQDRQSTAHWPHPQYWQADPTRIPNSPAPDLNSGSHLPQRGETAALFRTQTNAKSDNLRLPKELDPNAPPSRQVISQDIWPLHLYPALLSYDHSLLGVRLNEQISHRITGDNAHKIHAFLAHLVNCSGHFSLLGLRQLRAIDFKGVTTFMQACDRIDMILHQS